MLAALLYFSVFAAAAYGFSHGLAVLLERLTTRKPKLYVVPPTAPSEPIYNPRGALDADFDALQAKAGISIHALLAKPVDLTPTPESIALHKAFLRRERWLRRQRLTREWFANKFAQLKLFFNCK